MKILDPKVFKNNYDLIKDNFFASKKESDAKIIMIYEALADKLTNKMFQEHTSHIILNTTTKEWNDAYGYQGCPAVADWLKSFLPKKIEKSKYEICKITGARLVRYYLDYPDNYLQEIKNHQKRLQLNSEKKQLEGQQAIQNQKNIQTYIKQINNNLKSK